MQFSAYIKSCRENLKLTQEQLVQALYLFDTENFEALDANTVSKWERGVVKPLISKQLSLLRFFQQKTELALPCWEGYSTDEAEKEICKVGMKNLVGKSKRLILDFPSNIMQAEDLNIAQLRNSDELETIIDIHLNLDQDYNHGTTEVNAETLQRWALFPGNSFFVCHYKEQFFGLLFSVRLKSETFDRLMRCEIQEKDLTLEDFVGFDEKGSNYMFSFFAMNEKVSAMLFIRYYAHLIAHQKVIEEVGIATMMPEAKKLIESLNLRHDSSLPLTETLTLKTFRAALPNFIASENVLKVILSKQDCPEV